ncbi:helix-turn-helix domain-containing protein [Cellulomonas gilvus]|uniref:Helix-turn-helix domain protein n=1 Tax=Cellulomonas gilvus (strain ATCC 13127 / NRRL B-14078) TaxID=593907 RepID=F8A304_CELGA|nr:helix-turn-helix transcriptional regulator [Cellulomonas gilvus]AEI11859.1 helix-turn-helix domain protein [Cellulomonas gilvus ATCC 13127]
MTAIEVFGDSLDPDVGLARSLVRADRDFLESLIKIRCNHGLSQTEVAELMGVSPSAVSRIESGMRDLRQSTLRRYAFAVGAEVDHVTRGFDRDKWEKRMAGSRALPSAASLWRSEWSEEPDAVVASAKAKAKASV